MSESAAIHLSVSLSGCKNPWLHDEVWLSENMIDILGQSGIAVSQSRFFRYYESFFLVFKSGWMSLFLCENIVHLDIFSQDLSKNELETMLSRIASRVEASEIHSVFLRRGRHVKVIRN